MGADRIDQRKIAGGAGDALALLAIAGANDLADTRAKLGAARPKRARGRGRRLTRGGARQCGGDQARHNHRFCSSHSHPERGENK